MEAYLLELSLFEPLPVRALPPLPLFSFRLIPFCPRGVERYYHVLLEAECRQPGWFSLIGPPEEVEACKDATDTVIVFSCIEYQVAIHTTML